MKKSYTFGLASLVVTLAKKQTTKKIGFVAGLLLAFGMTAFSQTNYYVITDSIATGKTAITAATVTKAKFWSTNGSVTGQRPADFITDGQIFNIQASGLSNTKVWVVSGVGSKIVVGTDTTTTLTFTSTSPSSITATIDVKPNSTFIYNSLSTSTITWGTLSTGSTVDFGGSTAGFQEVIPASYANLSLKSNGGGYPAILPNGKTVSVSGVFTPRGGQIYGSTIAFNGGGGQVIPAGIYYNLSITGNKTNPDTLRGNVIVEGTYSNNSTGATIQPYTVNPITKAITNSTLTLNGFGPQTISNHPFGNITFANGQNSNISSINNSAATVTLQAPDPGLSVGDIVTAKNTAFALDSATSILAINQDTILTLSNAPKLQLFVHEVSGARDTVLINSWNVALKVDSAFTLSSTPTFNVGDTVTATIIAAPTYSKTAPFPATAAAIVSSISGNTIRVTQISNKGFTLQNANSLGVINFGSPTGKPSAKTISGLISITGTFTPGTAPVTTTGSTVEFIGKRQNVPGITYDNLVINQDSATTAALQASATVEGTFTLQSGKLATNTTTKLLTIGENAVFTPVTNDTFFIAGGLAKKFAATKPFTYKVGAVVAGVGTPRTVTVTPATADAKTYTVSYGVGKTSNATKIDSATIVTLDTLSYYNVALSGYAAGVDTTAQISFEFVPSSYFKDSVVTLAHYFHGKYTADGSVATFNGTTPLTFTTSGNDSIFGRYAIATASPTLVPVKIGTVSAALQANKSIKVSWNSYTETNVSKYIVEGSVDGNNFATKGSLTARGAAQYSFTDLTPSAGTNYYRIKAIDVNGKATYSAVVSVKQTGLVNTNIAVYPNPVKNKQLNFVLSTDAANYTLKVTSILGQSVVARTISHNGGTASYSVALPSNVAKGTYFVKLSNGKDQLTKTITVE